MVQSFIVPNKVTTTKVTTKATSVASYSALCKSIDKKPTMVVFYASWCSHCKSFKPDLACLDLMIQEDDDLKNAVKFVMIEHSVYKNVVAKCPQLAQVKVTAFPTTALLVPGNPVAYMNSRDCNTLYVALKDAVGKRKKTT
eukprot:gene19595-26278_t